VSVLRGRHRKNPTTWAAAIYHVELSGTEYPQAKNPDPTSPQVSGPLARLVPPDAPLRLNGYQLKIDPTKRHWTNEYCESGSYILSISLILFVCPSFACPASKLTKRQMWSQILFLICDKDSSRFSNCISFSSFTGQTNGGQTNIVNREVIFFP